MFGPPAADGAIPVGLAAGLEEVVLAAEVVLVVAEVSAVVAEASAAAGRREAGK